MKVLKLAAGFHQRLALLSGQQLGQRLALGVNQLGSFEQQFRALFRCRVRPFVKGRFRRINGAARIFGIAARHGVNHFAVGGVAYVIGLAGQRSDRLSCNKHSCH